MRRTSDRERKKRKITTETTEERQSCNSRESKRKREMRARVRSCPIQTRPKARPQKRRTRPVVEPPNDNEQTQQETAQRNNGNSGIQSTSLSSNTINKEEQELLLKFRKKMDDIQYGLCSVCNERIPSMKLIREKCKRCHTESTVPKKFSEANCMDPRDVPEELKELSEIEEMLIAQVLRLCQYIDFEEVKTGIGET